MSNWLQRVILASQEGKVADFENERLVFEAGGGDEPVLAAEDLRALLLGLYLPSLSSNFDTSKCFRWEIKSARVTGRLDLRDARLPSGTPLPALEFLKCIFEQGLSGDGAHLERLHLSGCSFGSNDRNDAEISLKSVRIDNELRLNDLKPITADGLFRIDMNSANIGANVVLKHTVLRAKPNVQVLDPSKTPYGLNLRNAIIRADLFLYPEVSIHGGIMAQSAKIGGDIRAFGLNVDDGSNAHHRRTIRESRGWLRSAVRLDSAHVGGDVWFISIDDNKIFTVTGLLSMDRSHVGGNLTLTKAFLDCGEVAPAENDTAGSSPPLDTALSLQGATIAGNVAWWNLVDIHNNASLADVRGVIALDQLTIGGQLNLFGPFVHISATGISVTRDVRIKTELQVRQNGPTGRLDKKGDNAYALLNLGAAIVKGSVYIESTYANQQWEPKSSAEGGVGLSGAHISGNLSLGGIFDFIEASGLVLDGNCTFDPPAGYKASTVIYSLVLGKAIIGGDLDISKLKFFNREFLRAEAKWRRPRPSLQLFDATIKHGLRLGRPAFALHNSAGFVSAKICQPTCYRNLQIVEVKAKRPGSADASATNPSAAFLVKRNHGTTIIDGGSSILHQMNKTADLRLSTEEQQRDYLRLFCSYVWGDEGAFKIVEYNADLPLESNAPPIKPLALESEKSKDFVRAKAYVLYGNHLFSAKFKLFLRDVTSLVDGKERITIRGMVEMEDDTPLYEFDSDRLTTYAAPLRFAYEPKENPDAFSSDFVPERGMEAWQKLSESELTALVANWSAPFRDDSISLNDARVDLTDACCGTLEDSDGVAWGADVELKLENFTYSHIKATGEMSENTSVLWRTGSAVAGWWFRRTKSIELQIEPLTRRLRRWFFLPERPLADLRMEDRNFAPQWFSNLANSGNRSTGINERLRWLEQHVVTGSAVRRGRSVETVEPFLQQPYVHLAKVLREQGDEVEARIVEAQRIRIDRWLRAKRSLEGKVSLPLFGLFRIFFFYGLKPLRAFATFMLCILFGWGAVKFANDHRLMVQATTTVASTVSPLDPATALVPYQDASGQSELPCGSSISNSLYAVDVFIPLLDLRQEGRCDVRSASAKDVLPSLRPSAFKEVPSKVVTLVKAMSLYPPLWQWLKACYAVLGWIVTSLTILTFSGTLRKWDKGN